MFRDVKFLPLKEKEKLITEIILIIVALRRRRTDLMGSERTSASIKGLNKNLKVTQEMRGPSKRPGRRRSQGPEMAAHDALEKEVRPQRLSLEVSLAKATSGAGDTDRKQLVKIPLGRRICS